MNYLNTFCPTHNRRMINGPVDIHTNRQVEICYAPFGSRNGICGTMLIDRSIVDSILYYKDGKFYTCSTNKARAGNTDKEIKEGLFSIKMIHAENIRKNRGVA